MGRIRRKMKENPERITQGDRADAVAEEEAGYRGMNPMLGHGARNPNASVLLL